MVFCPPLVDDEFPFVVYAGLFFFADQKLGLFEFFVLRAEDRLSVAFSIVLLNSKTKAKSGLSYVAADCKMSHPYDHATPF